jgi:hypothetical protein
MTLIAQSFPSLIGGVSQQAPSQRLQNQVELQENCLNSITQGMRKRPCTEYLAELNVNNSLDDAYIHQVKRDSYEQYIMAISQNGIDVYDRSTGFRYPMVNVGSAVEYLKLINTTDSERNAYLALTSADTTYILNRTQPVLRTNSYLLLDDNKERQSFTVGGFSSSRQNGQPYGEYRLSVNGSAAVTRREDTSPDEVAQALGEKIREQYPNTEVTVASNTAYVDRDTGSAPISVTDNSITYRNIRNYEFDIDEWYPVPQKVLTVKDDAVVVNTLEGNEPALVHVRQADYSVRYTVVINGLRFSHVTPEATSDRARAGLSLKVIMNSLADKINNSSLSVTATVGNGYIYITHDGEMSLSVEDDLNGLAIVGIHKSAQLFSDLPSKAPDGFLVKIVGAVESTDNGYWVEFVQEGELGQGYWQETRAPNQTHEIDRNTMPHVLKREASKSFISAANPAGIYFKFEAAEWDERKVGDDEATPFPSFVSEWDDTTGLPKTLRYIHSMTFHKNRLALSSDENVVFSESGNYWNFFRTTAQVVKDSDPIDISILSPVVNPILGMVSGQKELMLYGSRRQYSLKSGDIFSADTVFAESIASYDVDLAAQPQYVGNSVYFVVNREKFNGIYESQVRDEQHNALDVTAHVPEYIEGRVKKLATSGSEDVLLVLTDERNKLYQYSHKTQGQDKVHSAWNTWTFTQDLIDVEIEGSVVYLVTKVGDKYFTEVMNLSEDNVKDTLGVPAFLDQRQEVSTDTETPEGKQEVVYKNRKFIGYPYVQKATLTQLYIREQGNQTVQTGRLQLRRLTLNFDETTSFDVEVKQEAREARTVKYEGRVLGSITQRIGQIPVDNGTLKVPLFGRSKGMEITIINDTPFDCRIQSGEWEGLYHNRARRA